MKTKTNVSDDVIQDLDDFVGNQTISEKYRNYRNYKILKLENRNEIRHADC